MKYFELKCLAYLKRDIEFTDSFDILSKYINFSMCQKAKYEKSHNKNEFKNYCFGNFYPIEKAKIYKAGNNYSFIIRSLDEEFINDLENLLRQNINNSYLQVLQTTRKVVKQFFISELYTVTPVIVSVKDKNEKTIFWTLDRDGDILKLQKQLQDNLEKKYQDFYGEEIKASQNFIQLLEIKNKKPQSIFFTKNTKDNKVQKIRLFGNKFRIIPNEDEISQNLAFIAISCGLGEKQSYGGGVCIWN
jgi:CRISPR-associated endoribonuclease Cas6